MPPAAAAAADWKTTLQPLLPRPIATVVARNLASLWAGYGSVQALRVTFNDAAPEAALIAKSVNPPRDSGISHERKLASYACELAFYRDHARTLLQRVPELALPRPLLATATDTGGFTFVLSDLRPQFPVHAPDALNDTQVRAALSWLAAYHAAFWEAPTPQGLQEQGSYWYLDTRREELVAMGRSWAQLRGVADALSAALQPASGAPFATVIHGDMKHENLLFTADGSRCAAYDFQYTGRSYGVRDVVYLFASSVDSAVLTSDEDALLSYYHDQLAEQLAAQHGAAGAAAAARYDSAVLRRHFALALLDYVRFMAGWGTWGSGLQWALRRCRELLPRVQELLAAEEGSAGR